MSTKLHLIFDVETIIDEELFQETAKFKHIKAREETPDYVAPIPYNIPICLSYIVTFNKSIDVKPTFKSIYSNDPKIITNSFFEVFYKTLQWCKQKSNSYPILVTYNGIYFDIPLMVIRGIKHFDELSDNSKVALKEFIDDSDKWEKYRPNYRSKYSSNFNIDLFQFFHTSLKTICRLYNIQSKTVMDSTDVKNSLQNPEDIAKYCAEDVLSLTHLLNSLYKVKGEEQVNVPESIDICEIFIK